MKTILALVLVLLALSPVQGLEVKVYCGTFPPYAVLKDGKPYGIAVDILNEITKAGGPTFKFDFDTPWARALEAVKTEPTALIVPLTRSAARESSYQWVAELYPWTGRLVSYARTKPIQTAGEALKLDVGVSNGSVLTQVLKDGGFLDIDIAKNDEVNAQKLVAGHLDAWAILDYMDKYYFDTLGLDRSKLQNGPQIGGKFVHYLGAGKGFSPEMAQSLAAAVKKLRDSGEVQKILARYE